MKCVFQDVPGSMDEQGHRKVLCVRSGCRHGEGGNKPLRPTSSANINADCTGTPAWHEFGCWIELLLSAVYLDKLNWLAIKNRLGFQPKCGCDKRAEAANGFGKWFAGFIRKLTAPPRRR